MHVRANPETQPFWDHAARSQLALPWCTTCSAPFFYPRARCPRCLSAEVAWRVASGRGHVASFVIVHRAPPGVDQQAPYVVAIVELQEGVRMMANLVEIDPTPEAVTVGMPVDVTFDPSGELVRPLFRPGRQQ